jgi:hypothetical protein
MNGASVRKLLRRIDGLLPESWNSSTFRVVGGQRVIGKFYGATITSAFQTLRDPASRQILAHEALARSYSANGAGLSPWGLFADASTDEHLIALDRLCRTVHVLNYCVCGLHADGGTLVLNVHERLLHAVVTGHGAFFRQVLDVIDVLPASIVIDIPQLKSADVHWLKHVVESYRRAGFGVAIEASSALQAKLLGAGAARLGEIAGSGHRQRNCPRTAWPRCKARGDPCRRCLDPCALPFGGCRPGARLLL